MRYLLGEETGVIRLMRVLEVDGVIVVADPPIQLPANGESVLVDVDAEAGTLQRVAE